MKIGSLILVILSVLISLGFLISGFSVGIDPRISIHLALFSMTFPAWVLAMIVITIIDILAKSRYSIIAVLISWIIGFYNVVSISPFNISRSVKENEIPLKVMTYNVFMFNIDIADSLATENPTLNSIINSGADIVALQEAYPIKSMPSSLKITKEQCQKIDSIYPFQHYNNRGQALYSKFYFDIMTLPENPGGSTQFMAYKLSLPGNKIVALFNVHLHSFRLNLEDRKIYYEITEGEVSKALLSEARRDIFPKVKKALSAHAVEAEILVNNIKETWPTGPMILCGDFNDIEGSYPIKLLERECGLRDAFRDGAFGPTYTYHGSRFYFNIDHILYRDFPKPLSTKTIKTPGSDHYPLLSTFVIEDPVSNNVEEAI